LRLSIVSLVKTNAAAFQDIDRGNHIHESLIEGSSRSYVLIRVVVAAI
jgi:hypothetical protein